MLLKRIQAGTGWNCILQQSLKIWQGIYMLENDNYKLEWGAWKIQGQNKGKYKENTDSNVLNYMLK